MKINHVIFLLGVVALVVGSAWVPSKIFVSSPDPTDDGRVIQVPVVFNIMFVDSVADNGIDSASRNYGNSSAYLTREKLLAEMADLDNDFQQKNADLTIVSPYFKAVIGNSKVHFYLKQIIWQWVASWRPCSESNTAYLHAQSPVVDPAHCLNVYTGKIRYAFGGTDGVTPVRLDASTSQTDDAVNLSYLWVGLHYRLLTHETGHWMGLWHVFDESQLKDGITDIPVQQHFTDGNCVFCPPAVREQQSEDPSFKHTNYNNFMDYSGCRVMFSAEQASRIRYVVQHFRSGIWDSSAGH